MSVEMKDLFALPDFGDEDEEKEDEEEEAAVQPHKSVKGKKKPVIEDDKEEEDEEEEEDDDEDEDYEQDDNEEEEDDDVEEEDVKIVLQEGKVDERNKEVQRKKKEESFGIGKPKGTGQRCANIGQAKEFCAYIKNLMKNFQERVKEGKQVKKYFKEMIDDVHEACMNMRYPGMDFDPEEIVTMFLDPSCKAW